MKHYKIGVSVKFGERKKRGVCGSEGLRENLDPAPMRIWSPQNPKVMLDRALPLETLRSAAGSVFFEKKRPKRDQILFLQHIYIYICICICMYVIVFENGVFFCVLIIRYCSR